MWLSHERYETEFAAETDRLGALALAADPTRTVLTCPQWTVRDLVAHVGRGHRWSAAIIEERVATPPPFPDLPAPDDPADWPGWLRSGSDRLTAAIRAVGPQTPVWTWQPDKRAKFWLRRMLHDEVIHRFDLELTRGEAGELGHELAGDGVRDWLDCVTTLSRVDGFPMRGLVGTGQTVRLSTSDADEDWIAQRTPAGVVVQPGPGEADVHAHGPVRELLLVLNRRLPADRLTVTGDAAVFADWLDQSRF
jgi:uncharacterized protein (TIGR03083 family)